MRIDNLLKQLDDPRAPVSYPIRPINYSDSGHPVIGLDQRVQALVRQGQPLVPPLQVVRRPGLGDKVFALAALHQFVQENPEVDVTFSGLDTDEWLELVPWVKIGVNDDCNTVANLDNTPPNGEDRVLAMGRILGVTPTTIEFPINIPKRKHNIKKPYYVFVPFAARCGPRSLPIGTILSILQNSPLPLAFTDVTKYDMVVGHNVTNCTGIDLVELLPILADCEGVIGADTGLPWLGAALGKPCLIMFSHINPAERTATTRNVLSVRPGCLCSRSCGDHIGTRPECSWKDAVPKCTAHLTPPFVRFQMREFERLT